MYRSLDLSQCGSRTQCCPHCQSTAFRKHGVFYRKDDARRVPRFYCNSCTRTFSRAGYSLFYRHRHRRLTRTIERSLAERGTIRGVARLLGIDKDTVARRLRLLGRRCRYEQAQLLERTAPVQQVQFDELITFEHSKMKPVSVFLVTDVERWRMLGFVVARIPASGLLAEKSRKKYGYRPDESFAARHRLMRTLSPRIAEEARVASDSHAAYPDLLRHHLPGAYHQQHRSAPAAVIGQGELKKLHWDPLFCINHQLAMCRAHISRLFRKTWNTTKNIRRLRDHISIFMHYYNTHLRPRSGLTFEATNDSIPFK